MKKERVILGMVTLVVAATSALAFKSQKNPGAKTLWTVTTGHCRKAACWTAANITSPCSSVTGGYRTAVKNASGVTICTTQHSGTTTN
jgi:CDP-diacylglycerol pyrophosphatase